MRLDKWPSHWIMPFELRQFDDRIANIELDLKKRINNGELFSLDRKPELVYIADFLRSFELHPAFIHNFAEELQKVIRRKRGCSITSIENVGDLIDLFHRFSKLDDFLMNLVRQFDEVSLNSDFSDEAEAKLALRSYCIKLRGHLSAVSSILSAKHASRKQAVRLQSNFCVLCWRRVRHFEVDENLPRDRESKFYCELHSPSKNTSDYQTAVNALVAAVRTEKTNDFRLELTKYDNRKSISINLPPLFEKWFRSFMVRVSPAERKVAQLNTNWRQRAVWLLFKATYLYPTVADRIGSSLELLPNSWRDWVLNVVSLLDDKSQMEFEHWRDAQAEDWTSLTEWQTILQLFARYEAYQYITNRKPTPGRPGNVKATIKNFILHYYQRFERAPTTAEIMQAVEEKLGKQVSKSTVSKARKELQIL